MLEINTIEINKVKNNMKKCSERIIFMSRILNLEKNKKRLKEINKELNNPSIWTDHKYALALDKEKYSLIYLVEQIKNLKKKREDVMALFHLSLEVSDKETFNEAVVELDKLMNQVKKMELIKMFSGKHDSANCYLDIQAGSGGIEAQDWASMLLRMYLRWSEYKGFKIEMIEESNGDIAGIKSATIKIIGLYAFGWFRTETGVHRLVRKSPFDSGNRRHTSFSSVFVYPEIDNDMDIFLKTSDIRIDVYRASGAGGQHVNKTESAVRIIHLPTKIVVQCQNNRSQHKNKDQALKQLRAKLYDWKIKKKKKYQQDMENKKSNIGWSSQIRSYVLDDSRIKDLRTNIETDKIQDVLDGKLDPFIEESLKLGF